MSHSNHKSRFGIISSHTVRRPWFPYQKLCADQHIVIDTVTSDKAGCIKHHGHVTVSMNKRKRWQMTDTLTEELSRFDCTVLISQHHLKPWNRSSSADCLCVYSQNTANTSMVKEANKKYARVEDLYNTKVDETEQNENYLPKQRKKKRRGYKRKHQSQIVGKVEENANDETIVYCKMYSVPSRRQFQIQTPKDNYTSKSSKTRNGLPGGNLSFFENIYEDEVWTDYEDILLQEAIEESIVNTATESDTSCIQSDRSLADFIIHNKENMSPRKDCGERRDVISTAKVKNMTSHKSQVYYVDKSECLLPPPLETFVDPQVAPISNIKRRKNKKKRKQSEPSVVTPLSYNGDCPTFLALVDPVSLLTIQAAADKIFGHPVFVWGQSLPERFVIHVTSYIFDILANKGFNKSIKSIQESLKECSILVERYNNDLMFDMRNDVNDVHHLSANNNSTVRLTLIGFPRAYTTEVVTAYQLQQTDDIYYFNIDEVLLIMKKHIDMLSLSHFFTSDPLSCGKPVVTVDVISKVMDWKNSSFIITPKQLIDVMTADPHDDNETSFNLGEFLRPLTGHVIDCGICLKSNLISPDVVSTHATALKTCMHWFCNDCWRNYLKSRMEYGVVHLTCPAYSCTTEVDIVTLMSFISSAAYSRYKRQELESVRISHGNLEWCPKEGCSYLLHIDDQSTVSESAGVANSMICACGGIWCSCCKHKAHWPSTCQQNSLYNERFKNGGEFRGNITFISVKKCPSCRYPLEKFGGCLQIICRCSYQFCWSCCKEWNAFHYHCKVGKISTEEVDLVDVILLSSNYDRALFHRDRCGRSAMTARKTQAKSLLMKLTYVLEHHHYNTSFRNKCIREKGENSTNIKYKRIARLSEVLDGVLKFCSEVEFVLEHLEIYLTRRKAMDRSKAHFVSEINDRLTYISNQIHQILEQKTSFNTLIVAERLAILTNAGKRNLHNLACNLKN